MSHASRANKKPKTDTWMLRALPTKYCSEDVILHRQLLYSYRIFTFYFLKISFVNCFRSLRNTGKKKQDNCVYAIFEIFMQSSPSARLETIDWTERKSNLQKQNADRLAKATQVEKAQALWNTETKPKTWLLQKTNSGNSVAAWFFLTHAARQTSCAKQKKVKKLRVRRTVCPGQLQRYNDW